MSEMATFPDFLAARFGHNWVIAARLTDRLRDKGYTTALPPKMFEALQNEWETEVYGAPLKTLHPAAPKMLAALKMWAAQGGFDAFNRRQGVNAYAPIAFNMTIAAIAEAEGRP